MLRRAIVVVAALAALGALSSLNEVSAAARGAGLSHPHVVRAPAFHRHVVRQIRRARRAARFRRYWYWPYGGMIGAYLPNAEMPDYYGNYIDPAAALSLLQRLEPMSPPLNCHHSEETKTVPAEAGGTVQITITRC